MGGVRPSVVPGGVEFEGNDHVLSRALLELGLALDLRVRLGEGPAPRLDAVTRVAAALPWQAFLRPGQAVAVRATSRRSRVDHTGAIEERVLAGIRDVAGSLAAADDDPWRVFARLENNRLVLSLSVAGQPLSRRGWRLEGAKAPLAETLARAVLDLSGFDRSAPVIDPFCGSGTLLIEAARWARRIPPGWDRQFHYERSPIFDEERWARIRAQLGALILPTAPAPVLGSDRDAGAVEAARQNAARAGVGQDIGFEAAALGAAPALAKPPPSGLWVSNPPFGDRVAGGEGLRNLYQSIGHRFRQLPAGWRLALLAADPKLAHGTGLELESLALLDHGGKKVRLYRSR